MEKIVLSPISLYGVTSSGATDKMSIKVGVEGSFCNKVSLKIALWSRALKSGGSGQSIWSTVSDAIVRRCLWSTATGSYPFDYFSIITEVVDIWPPKQFCFLFLDSFLNSCGCSTDKSKTPPYETIFFTHLPVQSMDLNHPWSLVIENWLLF